MKKHLATILAVLALTSYIAVAKIKEVHIRKILQSILLYDNKE